RDSLSQEFVARRLWWLFVTPCVARSVRCERERLYRSLRIRGWQRDLRGPWQGGRVIIVVACFPIGSECELQESVAAVAGCVCCKRGCWFARAAVRFIVGMLVRVGVSRRLREPTCGVAFTGAGLWYVEPVEDGVFARAKQMLVCYVAPLVEHCDTCLWLLSALFWLVVSSGGVLPEFFSIGSGGKLLVVVLVRVSLSGTVSVLVDVFRCVISSSACLPLVKFPFVLPCRRALANGCLASVVGVWLAVPLIAVLRAVATFVVKVPPLELI
ncbi:hypothetical protein Taro_005962, partial [Colocasia esculenta]|nr:hypothetical protein [Colocasia esculenta]